MQKFILTVDMTTKPIKPGVHVAQMLREAAATIEYPVEIPDHGHVYYQDGLQKYEWSIEDGEPAGLREDKNARRA